MLEANPSLGYRDVQEILAYSARAADPDGNDWEYNGARNWNGGGLHYDALTHDLGFGLVEARAAVRLAETWSSSSHTSANVEERSYSRSPYAYIPDNGLSSGMGGAIDTVHVDLDMKIERIDVTLNVTHPWIGDLYVLLNSPTDTTSFLISRPGSGDLSAFGSSQANIHFTLDTVLDWGESPQGDWTIGVFDEEAGLAGTLDSWTITFIGAPTSTDDTYVYTDEFAEACADQGSRSILVDASGTDTLNASACSGAAVLDLRPGSTGLLDGCALTVGANTVIENAFGGDGHDSITGNLADNVLDGMRGSDFLRGEGGNDSLVGGEGNDTIDGGSGDDTIAGGIGNDTIDGGSGSDSVNFVGLRAGYTVSKTATGYSVFNCTHSDAGTDTLTGVETLQFSNGSLNLGWLDKAAALPSAQLGSLLELYIAYYNRAPDTLGLYYWAAQLADGMSLTDITRIFFSQPETQAAYPAGSSWDQLVTKVYNNVLGRAPDDAGKAYWVGELSSGRILLPDLITTVIWGAKAAAERGLSLDAAILANKKAVGEYFAITLGLNDGADSIAVMNGVNDSAASVSDARAKADVFAADALATGSDFVIELVGVHS